MYLIVVDAFSKWVKVAITHIVSSQATIEGIHHMFATHEVPDTWKTLLDSLVNNLPDFVPETTLLM